MIESIEKLRTSARNMAKGSNLVNYEECNLLLIIADEIEAEVDSRYMELPLDADGVPIRPCDLMACKEFDANDFDGKEYVLAVSYDCWVDKEGLTYIPCNTRHVKPRTVEDVLLDFLRESRNFNLKRDGEVEETIAKYADELRMRGEE